MVWKVMLRGGRLGSSCLRAAVLVAVMSAFLAPVAVAGDGAAPGASLAGSVSMGPAPWWSPGDAAWEADAGLAPCGNTEDCPGGWCRTEGLCEACCPEGDSPSCTSERCRCVPDNSLIGLLKRGLRKLKGFLTGK